MPNCFQLFPKGKNEPEILQVVDDKMREHFGVEPSKDKWLNGWYENIGFLCALGKSWDEIRKIVRDFPKCWENDEAYKKYCEDNLRIVEWLEENYTTTSWAKIGKR